MNSNGTGPLNGGSRALPLVSVVTPVYNGEPYIRECIESVLAQTYPAWDYTIVNNCSTDRTREIAVEYAARDPRIRLHDNAEFVSCEANHNIAVRQISDHSKYCKILAADDWLFPECLAKMVQLADANPTVGIVSAYGLRDLGRGVTSTGLPYSATVFSGRSICRATLMGGPYIFGQPTSLLYRADLTRTRHAFFNESHPQADTESCYEFLQDTDFGFVHQILYFIRTHEDSQTSYADELNTYLSAKLYFLEKFGPVYLEPVELEQRVAHTLDRYYAFLSRSLFERRDRAFWTFHKNRLHELGHPIRYSRLARLFGLQFLDLILNPKHALEAGWRRGVEILHKRRSRNLTASRPSLT